jgi:hypothetical protein
LSYYLRNGNQRKLDHSRNPCAFHFVIDGRSVSLLLPRTQHFVSDDKFAPLHLQASWYPSTASTKRQRRCSVYLRYRMCHLGVSSKVRKAIPILTEGYIGGQHHGLPKIADPFRVTEYAEPSQRCRGFRAYTQTVCRPGSYLGQLGQTLARRCNPAVAERNRSPVNPGSVNAQQQIVTQCLDKLQEATRAIDLVDRSVAGEGRATPCLPIKKAVAKQTPSIVDRMRRTPSRCRRHGGGQKRAAWLWSSFALNEYFDSR